MARRNLVIISLWAFLTTFVASATIQQRSSSESNHDSSEATAKRQTAFFPVVGIPDNQIRVRYPVQTLYDQFRDQFTLFMLGMQDFQAMDQNDPLSYYRIAGIHGFPAAPWNNVNGPGYYPGYCFHISILFPTWHRAYMGLFEQQWKVSVDRVVQRFPAGSRRNRYKAAAATIRFPYLDWANRPSNYPHVIPFFITDQTISIDTPKGVQTIFNPLFRYTFHPFVPRDMYMNPWASWPVTLRNPDSQAPNAKSQNALMTSYFDSPNIYNSIRQSVYDLFTLCPEFTEFSNNHAGSATPNCHTSLESIHDQVHGLIGGNNGSMSVIPYAAFDPLFWLHHMNIERLFAMWQATNKNSYYDYAWRENVSNFMVPAGQITDSNTPLWPFTMDTQGNFWKPNNIFNHRSFRSTFPEFVNWDGNSASMRAIVNRLYGSPSGGVKKNKKRDSLTGDLANLDVALDSITDQVLSNSSLAALTTPQGKRFEYLINILTPRFALGTSYNVYCFLGQPTNDDYLLDNNMVGFVTAFAMPGMKSNALTSGAVPLTDTLVNLVGAKKLASLKPVDVSPFLKKNLIWKVVLNDGNVIDNSRVPGLKVSVVHSSVTPARNADEFPIWAQFDPVTNATKGKTGGAAN